MPRIILEFFCRGTLFLVVVLNKNIKLIVNYVAGPLIMFFLFLTVARQLQKQPHWRDSLYQMLEGALGKQKWRLFSMFGLMWVNWALEAYKWRIALKPVQEIGFFRAFKAIFAGTCIASFTPNRVGEYLGRMLFLDPGNKLLSIAPTIVCSLAQTLTTLVAGSVGLYLFSEIPFHYQLSWLTPGLFRTIMFIAAVVAIGLALVYFRFDPFVKRINRWLKRTKRNFSIPEDYGYKSLGIILVASAIRYGVFILQYFLLFTLFGVHVSGEQVFTGVSVMFVLMAIVPTLTFLTDLGFRWAVGIQIFQVFTSNTAAILAVSLCIWLINLIIPALVGSLLILRIKLYSRR
jgi:Lysylphosphatidylglycerol synthase TM region